MNKYIIKNSIPISFLFLGLFGLSMIFVYNIKYIEGNENMNMITPEKAALEVAESASQMAMRVSQNSNEEVQKAVGTVATAANLAAQSVLTGNKNPEEIISNINNTGNAIKKKRKF